MEYIKVENNIVKELISTDTVPQDNQWVEVSIEGGIHVGDDVRFFDDKWNIKNTEILVNEGLVKLKTVDDDDSEYPKGTVVEKIKNNEIVDKSEYDFFKEGLIELGPLEYANDDSETIEQANSVEDILNMDKITKEEAESRKSLLIRDERDFRLDILDRIVENPLRWADLSELEKESISNYRRLLLDIPQQDGFPWEVSWPQIPEAIKK